VQGGNGAKVILSSARSPQIISASINKPRICEFRDSPYIVEGYLVFVCFVISVAVWATRIAHLPLEIRIVSARLADIGTRPSWPEQLG